MVHRRQAEVQKQQVEIQKKLTEVIEKRTEERQNEIIDRVLKLAGFRNEWSNSAE